MSTVVSVTDEDPGRRIHSIAVDDIARKRILRISRDLWRPHTFYLLREHIDAGERFP